MTVHNSPGLTAPPAPNRSIYFYFIARLIVPVSCAVLLWGLVAAAIISGYPHDWHWLRFMRSGHHALAGAAVIAGTGIAVVLTAVTLMVTFARRLAREVDGLAMTARRLADGQPPRAMSALRERPQPSLTQFAAVADAIASMHRSAVAAAAAEAGLRSGFREILVSLGKRNQSLLHRQLRIIDALEQQAPSPAALADLFTLDHLTTRMRRHAESLTILSGAAPGRSWSEPVPVVDVMRAAVAEVEDYKRVTVTSESDEAVAAPAVIDMIHLLAELIENATLFSPSSTRVEVRGERVANGFAIEVEDRGLGIPPDQLRELNSQLATPPDFDSADADRLGLFVAGRLAARHGVYVSLAPSAYRGIKAVVVLPDGVTVPAPELDPADPRTGLAGDRFIKLNLGAPEVLSLAGPVAPRPPAAGEQVRVTDEMPVVTMRGLPRRVRPESESGDEGGAERGAGLAVARPSPVESPAPDAARSLAASLQSSWHRSRQVDEQPDSGFTADERFPAHHDAQELDGALDSED